MSFAPSPSYSMPRGCHIPSPWLSLANAFRSIFIVFTTHILSGQVDTTLPKSTSFASLAWKLSWLVRYYNPVNLCWRYYSMLAFRCIHTTENWGDRQLALINFEAHPDRAPIPYIVGEKLKVPVVIDSDDQHIRVRRLEIAGLLSSQGLLSVIAAYEGIMAVQFTVEMQDPALLPTIAKPLAILGLFRVMVSKWVANKVYVEPYPYPSDDEMKIHIARFSCDKTLAFGWVAAGIVVVLLSLWNFAGTEDMHSVGHCMQILYGYMVISIFLYHIALLTRGPRAFANRILCFDDWHYKLQTLIFVLLIFATVSVGLWDFVTNDFYIHCFRDD